MMGMLMLLEINDLDIMLAVYLIPMNKTLLAQLIQQRIDIAIIAWQNLYPDFLRPVFQAAFAIRHAPQPGE